MTNLTCLLYTILVTNWTDISPPVTQWNNRSGWWQYERVEPSETVLLGHVRSNEMVRVIHRGRTNEFQLSEGTPFLEIRRTTTPQVTTNYSKVEVVQPYEQPSLIIGGTYSTNGTLIDRDWWRFILGQTNTVLLNQEIKSHTNIAPTRR